MLFVCACVCPNMTMKNSCWIRKVQDESRPEGLGTCKCIQWMTQACFFSNQCSLASSSWGSQLLQLECYAAPRGEMKERRKKTIGVFFFFFFYFRRACMLVMLVGWTCLKESAVADELFCWLCRMVRDFSECKWWCRTLMEPSVQMKVHI